MKSDGPYAFDGLGYRSARAYVKGDLGRAGNFMMIIWVV